MHSSVDDILLNILGHSVAQLVEATSRKVAGSIPHGITGIFHEYDEYFLGGKGGRCLGLTTLPPSRAECLEIWEPQPPKTLSAHLC